MRILSLFFMFYTLPVWGGLPIPTMEQVKNGQSGSYIGPGGDVWKYASSQCSGTSRLANTIYKKAQRPPGVGALGSYTWELKYYHKEGGCYSLVRLAPANSRCPTVDQFKQVMSGYVGKTDGSPTFQVSSWTFKPFIYTDSANASYSFTLANFNTVYNQRAQSSQTYTLVFQDVGLNKDLSKYVFSCYYDLNGYGAPNLQGTVFRISFEESVDFPSTVKDD